MNWLNRKHELDRIDEEIRWKLDGLKGEIWRALDSVPESEQEKYIRDLYIGAFFTTDAESYRKLQEGVAAISDKINKREEAADIIIRLLNETK